MPQTLPLDGRHRGAGDDGSEKATLCLAVEAFETEVAAAPRRARDRTTARTVNFFMVILSVGIQNGQRCCENFLWTGQMSTT